VRKTPSLHGNGDRELPDAGDDLAMFNLGRSYFDGKGVQADGRLGLDWISKAARGRQSGCGAVVGVKTIDNPKDRDQIAPAPPCLL